MTQPIHLQFRASLRYNVPRRQWIAYHIKESFVWQPDQTTLAFRLPAPLFGLSQDGEYMLIGRGSGMLIAARTGQRVPITPQLMKRFSLGQRTAVQISGKKVILHNLALQGQTTTIDLAHELPAQSGNRVWERIDEALLSPNGRFLAIAFSRETHGFDNAWGAVYAVNGERLYGLPLDRSSGPLLQFSPDSSLLAVSTRNRHITVMNSATGQEVLTLSHSDSPHFSMIWDDNNNLRYAYRNGRNEWIVSGEKGRRYKFNENGRIATLALADANHIGVLLTSGHLNVYALPYIQLIKTYMLVDESPPATAD